MDIYSKALQNIKDRAINAQNEVNIRINNLRKDKEFTILEGEISGLEWEKARREVYSLDYSDIDKKLVELSKKYNAYLEIKGVKLSDLEPKYICKKCKDSGYVNGKMCECVIDEVKRLQYKKYPYLVSFPLKSSDINYKIYGKKSDYFTKIYRGLKERIIDNEGNLAIFTLQGEPGVGKSYIANFIAKKAIENNKIVVIINAIKLNKMFLEYHLAPIEEKQSVLSSVTNCDLLIIDDLGVEQNLNNVTIPYLYQILIDRLDKKTIITSNLSTRNLENKYDQRIISRLMDKRNSLVIDIKGEDLRL
ncbi:MAG: ATP-binding protein [Clostridia bacterium]